MTDSSPIFARRRVLDAGLACTALSAASVQAQSGIARSVSAVASQPVSPRATLPTPTVVAQGLVHPWAMAHCPDGRMLVTERPGRMRLISPTGQVSEPLAGVPKVFASGQGGLLDVVLSPEFQRDGNIFFAYAQPTVNGARTAIARAELTDRGLKNPRVIFAQRHDPEGGFHFGCRLVFAPDGSLFATLGDRYFQRDRAQDLSSHFGKVIRIRPDGSVPGDNPFVNTPGALPEIWSIGHRNMQGAALHPSSGKLWTTEHGAQGGDELNLTEAGKNYGWPVITWGADYGGGKIGEGTTKAGLEQPLVYWTPSIAPSGLCFATSEKYGAYPGWRNSLFLGALKFRQLVRLEFDGSRMVREERLYQSLGERVRDVRQGIDGLLYLLTDSADGKLIRLDP